MPDVRPAERLPDDLVEFYRVCGGAVLFEQSTYSLRIASPRDFTRANPEIVGAEAPDDISDSWYIVARGGGTEALSIDCHPARLGRCYDSFWDRHGVRGDCAVVAMSFTELLVGLLAAQGRRLYWLHEPGRPYPDAYD